jgi:N-acetylglucosaminyl-diphospho-decaprenol L-rhamnosyltransferase
MSPAETTSPTVSVVVVSYDSRDLPQSVASIALWAEVVVVEQHPQSTVVARVRRGRPDVLVIQGGANRGFGAACNLGAANSSGDVVVFLNPDATIDDASLRQLAVRAEVTDVGLVGPTILDARGKPDTRARNWSRAGVDAFHLLCPYRLIPKRWARDIPASDPRYAAGGRVPFVQGACMAVSRRAFFSAGGFDEQFFLYGEEEDLARRLHDQQRYSELLAGAVAVHIGKTTTEAVADFATEQLYRSSILIYRKHVGRRYALMGSLLLGAVLVLLLITAPVRKLTPWRRVETPAWCVAALRGVAAGALGSAVVPPLVGTEGDPWVG